MAADTAPFFNETQVSKAWRAFVKIRRADDNWDWRGSQERPTAARPFMSQIGHNMAPTSTFGRVN